MAEKPTLAETIRYAYKSEESATRDQRAREASRVGPTSSSRPPALQQQQAKRLKSNVPTPVSVPICAYCSRVSTSRSAETSDYFGSTTGSAEIFGDSAKTPTGASTASGKQAKEL
ncbi:hypothetical protein MRB53_006105 [Persea americana]|uniref:Uncharacterized protein n=1 Tax=Persea americana TaxID=3435 RepID=A0ACC2MGR2_PERAE|nr:hypothetical protein MRB53_006105 [Persea americana]